MTTFREETITCPACGAPVTATIVASTNRVGAWSDLMPITSGLHALPLSVAACACGYADFAGRMQETRLTPAQKHSLLEAELPAFVRGEALPAHRRFELAYRARSLMGEGERALGDLMLQASWCLRLEPADDPGLESHYRERAVDHFRRALEDPDIASENRRGLIYLMGELSRLLGRFEAAAAWFDRFLAEEVEDPDWRRIAEELSRLARAGDRVLYSMADLLST